MPGNTHKSRTSNKAMTLFVCFLAALAGLLFGLDIGVIAGALPFIAKDFNVTPHQQEWIVSSMMFGAAVGAIGSGWMSSRLGRKKSLMAYGGMARHGGGAFSGKDPSKVDRSAAYAARYVAKNIVAAGLADRCEIQVSYAIGVAEPTSIMVETFGTEKISTEQLTLLVREFFDLRPYGLIQMLDLLHPIYKETAAYGHFGREHFPWEKTDKAALLREAAGL